MRVHALLLPAASLLAACATAPPEPATVFDRELALPAPVAAAVIAGALRLALPFADPVPAAAGVPVLRPAGRHWRIAFTRDGRELTPCASHRLTLATNGSGELEIACTELPPALRTDAWRTLAGCAVDVTGDTAHARLRGTLPTALAAAVERALLLALDPLAPVPGVEEPNLAAWARHRLLALAAEADAAGEHGRAHACRQAVVRLGDAPPGLHAALARDAERRGQWQRAHDHDWQALLACDDPQGRYAAAAQLQAVAGRSDDARAWRRAARAQLRHADPALGQALLHTARRLRVEPMLDYRLQSQLHRLADDDEPARASALLAREHAGLDTAAGAFLAELWHHAIAPVPAAAPPR